MPGAVEKTYGKLFKYMLFAINPFKKIVIETECLIHKCINMQALLILKNDGFSDAFGFFSDYIAQINEGAVWADQDLKSAGHFYNPVKGRGLFGNKDALTLAKDYYRQAIAFCKSKNIEISMFYFGAALHLVQDMTIPQHANIRLLDSHRQYENFIKRTYTYTPEFNVFNGGYYIDNIEEAIRYSARNAIKIYDRLKYINNVKKRYYSIAKFTLPLAQRISTGCLLLFYKEITENKR